MCEPQENHHANHPLLFGRKSGTSGNKKNIFIYLLTKDSGRGLMMAVL